MAKARTPDLTVSSKAVPQLAELASLYRAIGISSVASAVAAQKMTPAPLPMHKVVPPLLHKERAFD